MDRASVASSYASTILYQNTIDRSIVSRFPIVHSDMLYSFSFVHVWYMESRDDWTTCLDVCIIHIPEKQNGICIYGLVWCVMIYMAATIYIYKYIYTNAVPVCMETKSLDKGYKYNTDPFSSKSMIEIWIFMRYPDTNAFETAKLRNILLYKTRSRGHL
jgi:hypothetical protein